MSIDFLIIVNFGSSLKINFNVTVLLLVLMDMMIGGVDIIFALHIPHVEASIWHLQMSGHLPRSMII